MTQPPPSQPPGSQPPGGYRQPGAQPQGPIPPGGRPPGGNKGLLIGLGIGGGVFIIGIILALVLWVLPSGSPEDVVKDFANALAEGDVETARSLTCKEDRDNASAFDLESIEDGSVEIEDFSMNVTGKEKVESEKYNEAYEVTYTVKATLKAFGQTQTIDEEDTGTVVKEDGEWRVCDSI